MRKIDATDEKIATNRILKIRGPNKSNGITDTYIYPGSL